MDATTLLIIVIVALSVIVLVVCSNCFSCRENFRESNLLSNHIHDVVIPSQAYDESKPLQTQYSYEEDIGYFANILQNRVIPADTRDDNEATVSDTKIMDDLLHKTDMYLKEVFNDVADKNESFKVITSTVDSITMSVSSPSTYNLVSSHLIHRNPKYYGIGIKLVTQHREGTIVLNNFVIEGYVFEDKMSPVTPNMDENVYEHNIASNKNGVLITENDVDAVGYLCNHYENVKKTMGITVQNELDCPAKWQ
jgi:hypothetical protein